MTPRAPPVDTSGLPPEPPAVSPTNGRWWLPIALLYALPWLIYAVLLLVQPSDELSAWHNDVAWPAVRYLTVAQDGLVLPILGQWLLGGVGGLLLATAARALVSRASRLLRIRDLGPTVGRVLLVLAPLWAFAHFKALPGTVTVFVRGGQVEVHRFDPWTALPAGRFSLRGDQLRALGSYTAVDAYGRRRYLLLYARTLEGELVDLGQRPCDGEPEPCLASGDVDLVKLARWLRFAAAGPPDAGVRPGHHILRRAG